MKKKILLFTLGISTFALALGAAAFTNASASFIQSRSTDDNIRTLVLNHDNSPAELPASMQNGSIISSSVTTTEGNNIPLRFALAKAYDEGFVTLGNHGMMYNFGEEMGRLKGIVSITAVFTGTLTFSSGNYEFVNDGAYIDSKSELTTGTKFTLPNPARYFSLTSGDEYSYITSITIEYSCTGASSELPSGEFLVEDFSNYSATGDGWDANHNYYSTSGLKSAFYSSYRNTGTSVAITDEQLLSGTGWNLMGNTDYVTYLSSLDGQSDVALLKATSTNNMRYMQDKIRYGIPNIIGRGNTLSLKMHSAYTSTAATSASSKNVVVKIFAFYNSKFDTSASSNTGKADIAEYTVFASTGWSEYKMDLDSSKEYYAFGLCMVMKSLDSTIYVPIDDIKITTENKTKTSPSGNYYTRVTAASITMPVVMSFAEKANKFAVYFNNNDAQPVLNSFTIDENGNFSFNTNGSYSSFKYGTISGRWDKATDKLVNVGLNGNIKNYVNNNGNITLSVPTLTYDCDGDNSTLRTTFRRQYYDGNNWNLDNGNADRISASQKFVACGTSSIVPRMHSSYRTGVLLNNAIMDKTCGSICLWVYNPTNTSLTINFTVYRTSNYLSKDSADRYVFDNTTTFDNGWTFYAMGFNHNDYFKVGTDTLYNFNLNVPQNRMVAFDSISFYA